MDLAYYGDDFTGSTDVLESLALAGADVELFVAGPQRAPFLARRVIGLAGMSRTFSPAEMEATLPAAFSALAAATPRFLHYKVCSTFDSSPSLGSIGRATSSRDRASTARPTGSTGIPR